MQSKLLVDARRRWHEEGRSALAPPVGGQVRREARRDQASAMKADLRNGRCERAQTFVVFYRKRAAKLC
eukprot:11544752-Alexandrium_andersonii.AAC.1